MAFVSPSCSCFSIISKLCFRCTPGITFNWLCQLLQDKWVAVGGRLVISHSPSQLLHLVDLCKAVLPSNAHLSTSHWHSQSTCHKYNFIAAQKRQQWQKCAKCLCWRVFVCLDVCCCSVRLLIIYFSMAQQ